MQNKSSSDIFFPHEVESLLPEDVVVLADSAGVALGLSRLPGARGRNVGDRGASIITSRYVEIPLVGSDGEVSGILFRTAPCSGTRGVPFARGAEAERSTGGVAQFVVHDINNLFAVIGGGLQLLERQSDVAYREAIVGTMQEAIARGVSLSRQLLDTARPCRNPIDGLVAGDRLAAITGTLHWALRPDITICIEIAPDLWTFNADPEGLYFALLNLCRNADDAMPAGGTITVSARNVELSADADRRFVEIVVADEGEGMPEEIMSQAFLPYFTTKMAGGGSGIGLPQVRRFAEEQGGAVSIESERGTGTLVRLLLPRVDDAAVRSSLVTAPTTCTPSFEPPRNQ